MMMGATSHLVHPVTPEAVQIIECDYALGLPAGRRLTETLADDAWCVRPIAHAHVVIFKASAPFIWIGC